MEKPNFERIAEVLKNDTQFLGRQNSLEFIWEHIVEYDEEASHDEWPYDCYFYPDNMLLHDLCKEFNIHPFYPDLRFLAYEFDYRLNSYDFNKNVGKYEYNYRKNNIELLSALSILNKHKSGISINLLRNQRVCASINNSEIVDVINAALMEYFRTNNPLLSIGEPFEFKDKSEYIDFRIKNQKAGLDTIVTYEKKKALLTKNLVYVLWSFLQNYTPMQAKEGSEYSNEQGRFIFRFLEIIGFIDNQKRIMKKEDVVGYYLKTYKKKIKNHSKDSQKMSNNQ